jgi:hypothetical protein
LRTQQPETKQEWLAYFTKLNEGGTGSTEPSLPPRAPPRTVTGIFGQLVAWLLSSVAWLICAVLIVIAIYGGYTVLAGMGDCHNNYDAQTGQAC